MVRTYLSGGSIPAETWRVGGSQTSRELGEESFRQRGNYKSSLSLVRAWYTWRKRKESQGSRVETMRRQVFQGEVREVSAKFPRALFRVWILLPSYVAHDREGGWGVSWVKAEDSCSHSAERWYWLRLGFSTRADGKKWTTENMFWRLNLSYFLIRWGQLPGGSVSKESACVRWPGFNPWVGKISWRRTRKPTAVFLPGESPWTEEPGGLQSMRSQRFRHSFETKYTQHNSN